MTWIDNFSPDVVGSSLFSITLDPTTTSPATFQAVIFDVDYSGADADGGVVLPVRVLVQAPDASGFFSRIYRRFLPRQVVYFPVGGGAHLVTVSELGHNRAFGSLPFQVSGDSLAKVSTRS